MRSVIDRTNRYGIILTDANSDGVGIRYGRKRFFGKDLCLPYRSHQSHPATARQSGIPTTAMKFRLTGVPPASPIPLRPQTSTLRAILGGSEADLGLRCWPLGRLGPVRSETAHHGGTLPSDPESDLDDALPPQRQSDAEPTQEEIAAAADVC